MTSTPQVYVFLQGNHPNDWYRAKEWQLEFLKEDHTKLTKSMFLRKGQFNFMNVRFSDVDSLSCESMKKTVNDSGLLDIDKYSKNQSWLSRMFFWNNSETPIQSAGFICNLSTGMTRMYIVTVENKCDLKHTGPGNISYETLEEYRSQFEKNFLN